MHSNQDQKPVLARITMNTKYKFFQMDKPEYTAYSDSCPEILLQDGITLQIDSMEEISYTKDYINKLAGIKDRGLNFARDLKIVMIDFKYKIDNKEKFTF